MRRITIKGLLARKMRLALTALAIVLGVTFVSGTLVLTDTLFPGFGNQYAALAAWDGQLTDKPLQNDRPSNLRNPADVERDFGAHGIFDSQAGGVMDPTFLRTLPGTAKVFVQALGKTMAEKRDLTGAKRRGRSERTRPR